MLIDHMAEGLSFESFAGVIGMAVSTLYLWTKSQKDFREAKQIGQAKSLIFYEKLGRSGFVNPKFNTSLFIFQMKCRFNKFGWNPDNQNLSYDEDDDENGFEFIGSAA